ncbi:PD-(D/E)XK nuclease family protein [Hyperthermus butylicus]|uniref:VRR-NUC domain-containing protein n=1 Tax=Hyperthermus butylicus (strain DSM 5456 / JCM 9403 / PLM1-5) TaxID=415426 RepID=A2BKP5_HYPBU|nr:PD-(D/E)XK nuclease family protein [Hyperthermus butylicus]ABM80556.1 hypothetical protein Hbut_0701 [Hyperthermus butylicus DSM 5456]
MRACQHSGVLLVGRLAREAAPPVVPASAIGSWHWCKVKAWHATTLFNTGWLRLDNLTDEALDGLALLWAAELGKKANPRIIRGKLVHGEQLADVILEASEYRLARLLLEERGKALRRLHSDGLIPCLGLIDPESFEEQLARYRTASDIVEYFRREEWPLIARRPSHRSYVVIGVPDEIAWDDGGVKVVELKTTGKPWLVKARRQGYRAALAQLAAYAWMLVDRWPLETAELVFKDYAGNTVLREKHDPLELAELFEKEILPIADELASQEPPGQPARPPCQSCEYNTVRG